MKRLLAYSLERNRAIRIMYMDEESKLRQITCVVTALSEREAEVYVVRPPKKLTLPLDSILSADFKKGDDGCE